MHGNLVRPLVILACLLATVAPGQSHADAPLDLAADLVWATDAGELGLEPHAASAPCSPNATNLCLGQGRFRVTSAWRTADGRTGAGQAVALTHDTGYFWFFQRTNAEFLIKILDACSISSRYWVFAGGLTNVRVEITVEDTQTGSRKTYRNPANTAFQPIQDTAAFGACPRRTPDPGPALDPTVDPVALGLSTAVGATATPSLLLRQGRFRVTTVWQRPDGQTGYGQPVQLTDETGYFWFFDRNNVEMILKILDGCGLGGRYWVFAGGLTNVEVEIIVEDLETGVRRRYRNDADTPFAPIQDTAALATCSTAGLPPDPGPAGRRTLSGIDSDQDGIRDDLQRHIALTHAGSTVTIQAARQLALTLQRSLADAASNTRSIEHANQLARDLECLSVIRPRDSAQVLEEILAKTLDTEARFQAYSRYNTQIEGEALLLKDRAQWSSSCRFRAVRNALGERLEAQNSTDKISCSTSKKATVFFVNGITTTASRAGLCLGTIVSQAYSAIPSADLDDVQFALSYNPTEGFRADLWEAVRQRFENDPTAFHRAISYIDPMPDFLREELVNLAAQAQADPLISNPVVQRHIELYKREILEGRKVILVAHSQGNFFANRAYLSLTPQQRASVGIVSVANPDSGVADGRPYTTLTEDVVIRLVEELVGAPDPTTDNYRLLHLRDLTGHDFIESYLDEDTASQARIMSHLRAALADVDQPAADAGDGIITVTLTWGAQPDVDLHVFEPSGDHVYYADSRGSVGFLDVDDVSGFGPEHYYAACADLEAGTYQVGVNYYRGSAPETATVQVKAGLALRTYQIRLNRAVGSAGDDSPIPVATVVVTGNPTTGFDLSVQ